MARSDTFYALEIEKYIRYGLSELAAIERLVYEFGEDQEGGDQKLDRAKCKRLWKAVSRRMRIMTPGQDMELERAEVATMFKQLAQDAAAKGDVANSSNALREYGKLIDIYPTKDKGAGKSLQELMALASAVNADGRVIDRAMDAAPRLTLAEDPYEDEDDAIPEEPEDEVIEEKEEPPVVVNGSRRVQYGRNN